METTNPNKKNTNNNNNKQAKKPEEPLKPVVLNNSIPVSQKQDLLTALVLAYFEQKGIE